MGALKELARQSPLLRSVFKQRYDKRFAENREEQLFRGIFATAAEAASSAPARKLGYDTAEAAGMYQSLMTKIESYDYPVLFWLENLLDHNPETAARGIFDCGGHIGLKRYAYRPLLGKLPEWTVFDVPAVVRRGATIARERAVTGLRFTDEFTDVAGKGILLCLGSLQYIEPSLASLLIAIDASARPRHVLLNTTAFTDEPAFYTLNSIGTAFCPYKIQNVSKFISEMEAAGYTLIEQWDNPGRACAVPFQNQRGAFKYLGMMFQR
jgi:putative methyltransferase (TIGR04325 family)